MPLVNCPEYNSEVPEAAHECPGCSVSVVERQPLREAEPKPYFSSNLLRIGCGVVVLGVASIAAFYFGVIWAGVPGAIVTLALIVLTLHVGHSPR